MKRSAVTRRLAVVLLCTMALPVSAKTLLDSPEKTFARECLDYRAVGEDLIAICERALAEGQYGTRQHARLLMALGDAYRWESQFDRAETAYRDILKITPASADAYNGLAWIEYDLGDYESAAEHFERSIAINPTNDGLGGLAGAGFRAEKLSTQEAVEYLDAALTIKPKDRWTLREKGWVYFNSRQYEDALAPFQAVIELDPEDSNAHKGMAKSLAELKRYEEALTHINRAAELDPESIDILIWRSHISRWNGHNLRALKDAQLVIDRRPDRTDGYVLKARAQSRMGFDALAIATMRAATADMDDNIFLRYWLASFLDEDGQTEEAFGLMQRTVNEGKPDEYDLKLYADLAMDLGKLGPARDAIARARDMAPWMSELGYYESRLLVLEGDYDEAEAVFASAVEGGMPPDFSEDLAQLLIKRGEMKRAIAFKARYTP